MKRKQNSKATTQFGCNTQTVSSGRKVMRWKSKMVEFHNAKAVLMSPLTVLATLHVFSKHTAPLSRTVLV